MLMRFELNRLNQFGSRLRLRPQIWLRLLSACANTFGVSGKMPEPKTETVSEYIDVNGVETHVLKVGSIRPRLSEDQQQQKQHLFLIIPGNPGIAEYYEQFMHTLWHRSGETIPVWCVSHAGHITGPRHSALGWFDIVRQPGPAYTLDGQLSHKEHFIKDNIPRHVSLILIGHSIGCYIILNLLPRIQQFDVLRCFQLFPTIERMAETPNGRVFTPVLNRLRWVLTAVVKLISYLRPSLHRRMLEFHFSGGKVPDCGMRASTHLFNPTCVNHCTFMARQEMGQVTDLQEDLLSQYMDKMSFYYGATDSWCPKEYCYSIRAKFPQADVRLCEMDFSHAFVLDAGQEMADTVWDWLLPHL